MPFGEFQDFADCVSKNKDKDNPEAFCGFIQKSIEGATANVLKIANAKYKVKPATASGCSVMCLATASFFQKDGANFAKFFLINGQENLKGWRVTEASLPKFLKTFIGKPFISEPDLAHFGADDLEVHEVMQEQEKFRVGDIVDVTFDPKTTQAEAIVKFHNTPEGERIWNEIQKGEAIYVSPAVAGFSMENPKNGQPIFVEWYGLHLARVENPAYGVFHASLKKTCTGDEKHCLDMLIASANIHTNGSDSSIISKTSSSFKMAEENIGSTKDSEKQKGVDSPKVEGGTGTDDTEEVKELRDENASLKSKVASLEKSTATVQSLTKQVADLEEKQEEAEEEEKKEVAEDIIEKKQEVESSAEDEAMTDDEVKEETASLMKKSLASLKEIQSIYKSASAGLEKQVASLRDRVGSKIVRIPSVASASKDSEKVTMETIRSLV
jgi:hypothetical protein